MADLLQFIWNDDLNSFKANTSEESLARLEFFQLLDKKISSKQVDGLNFVKPLFISAFCGSIGIFKYLLDNDVKKTGTEVNNNGIAHALIFGASYSEDTERYEEMYKFLLKKSSLMEQHVILNLKNKNGYNPLELSIKVKTYQLFILILNTEGVYVQSSKLMSTFSTHE